jgi:hypothetical protein
MNGVGVQLGPRARMSIWPAFAPISCNYLSKLRRMQRAAARLWLDLPAATHHHTGGQSLRGTRSIDGRPLGSDSPPHRCPRRISQQSAALRFGGTLGALAHAQKDVALDRFPPDRGVIENAPARRLRRCALGRSRPRSVSGRDEAGQSEQGAQS